MDPNKLFRAVISYVDNSQLNYCIYRKTPFSANILIKSSLISRTRSDVAENFIKAETNEPKENLEEENLELRGRLKIVE